MNSSKWKGISAVTLTWAWIAEVTVYNSFNLWMFARFEIHHGLEEITVLAVI